MKRQVLMLWAAALLCLPAAAQTVDDVIAKNIAARGGLDKLKAVQSVTITGRFQVGAGLEAPFVLRLKRPDHMRMEFTVQGMTAMQGYDGKSGWQVMPFTGKTDAEPMSADDLKDAQEEADIDGPLVDYKAKGHQVELAGKENVEGSPAYKLKLTLKNGDIEYRYIDADSYLEVKQDAKRTIRGSETDVEESLGDYKAVGGLMFPYAIESGVKGGSEKQKIIVEKIELNAPVDDALFKMPEAKPAEPKPAEQKPPAEKPKPPST